MKHLVSYGSGLTEGPKSIYKGYKLIKVSTSEYVKLRLQFWKWKKHRTMGRPILVLRKVWGKTHE